MERPSNEIAPAPEVFSRHLHLVQDYVRSAPGSHQALMAAASQEPEEMTMSIVALCALRVSETRMGSARALICWSLPLLSGYSRTSTAVILPLAMVSRTWTGP